MVDIRYNKTKFKVTNTMFCLELYIFFSYGMPCPMIHDMLWFLAWLNLMNMYAMIKPHDGSVHELFRHVVG